MMIAVIRFSYVRGVMIILLILTAGGFGQNIEPIHVVPATNVTVVSSGTNSLLNAVESICTNPALGKGTWRSKQVAVQGTNIAVVSVAEAVAGRTNPGAIWTLTGSSLTLHDVLRQYAAMYQCYLFETDYNAGFFKSSHYLKPACIVLSGGIRYADSEKTVSKLELTKRTGIGEAQILLSKKGRYLCVVEIETTTLRFYSGVRFYDYGEEPFAERCPYLKWLVDGQYSLFTSCTNLTLNTINHVDLAVPRSRERP